MFQCETGIARLIDLGFPLIFVRSQTTDAGPQSLTQVEQLRL